MPVLHAKIQALGRKRFPFLTPIEYNYEGRIERLTVFTEYQLYIAYIHGSWWVLPEEFTV